MSRIVENVSNDKIVVLTNVQGKNFIVELKAGQGISSSSHTPAVFDTYAEAFDYVNSNNTDLSYALRELPSIGNPVFQGYYLYNGKVVYCRQEHTRTIYPPEETPALFYFYRENPEGMEWMAQENVSIGDTRTYQGETYECIQAHVTQDGWEPNVATSLWRIVAVGIQEWVQPTGAHDAYAIGAQVTHNGFTWESDYNANVWEPGVFGWSRQ